MTSSEDFRPTATIETLKRRSRLLQEVRSFFLESGYWECETPVLSRDIIVDEQFLDPFEISHGGETLYLQTSPESGMKRLLAAGADSIFQISRVMRRGESGRLHNPEYTMIEWYRNGETYHDQMTFTEALVRRVYLAAGRTIPAWPFERLTWDEAFERFAGCRVQQLPLEGLAELAREHNLDIPDSLTVEAVNRNGWWNLLLAELVEPNLGRAAPQFLYDYPPSMSALARVRSNVAERFELYDQGVELCNGYQELTDADEAESRIHVQRALRRAAGGRDLPAGAPRLIAAMHSGLPDCSGVALGFDRLVMLALGKQSLAEVMAFPIERA